MTNVSLMEYMDPNNDLLRRLTIEATGTYQHSVSSAIWLKLLRSPSALMAYSAAWPPSITT